MKEKELVKLAASMEKPSEHPLADAIVSFGEETNAGLYEVSGFKSVPGEGIEGSIKGDKVYAGNLKMMERIGVLLENWKKKVLFLPHRARLLFTLQKRAHCLD